MGLINTGHTARLSTGKDMGGISCAALMGITHLLSLQPALEKNSAPFRLPQNHMLFGCLSETVSKGELGSGGGLEEMRLGCKTACVVTGMCGYIAPSSHQALPSQAVTGSPSWRQQ